MPTIQSAHLCIACHNAYVCTVIVRVFFIYHIYRPDCKRILALAKVRLAFAKRRAWQSSRLTAGVLSSTWCIAMSDSYMQWPSSVQGVQHAYSLLLEMGCQQTYPNHSRPNTRWVADSDPVLSIAWLGYGHVSNAERYCHLSGVVTWVYERLTWLIISCIGGRS